MNNPLWFNEGPHRNELLEKIERGWYVRANFNNHDNDHASLGKVIGLAYAGYKIQFLSEGREKIVNPTKQTIEDMTEEEYQQEAAMLPPTPISSACQHQRVEAITVSSCPSCDILEIHCLDCQKKLKRSWSTCGDKDPKCHITDWDWYERYCREQFGMKPIKDNFIVVAELSNNN